MPPCFVIHVMLVCCLVHVAAVVQSSEHDSDNQNGRVQPVSGDGWFRSESATRAGSLQSWRSTAPTVVQPPIPTELSGPGSPEDPAVIVAAPPSPNILAATQDRSAQCVDSSGLAVDSLGVSCSHWTEFPTACSYSLHYDDDDFTASIMCCACSDTGEPDAAGLGLPPLRTLRGDGVSTSACFGEAVTHGSHVWYSWSHWDRWSSIDCGGNRALVGIMSKHNNHREDRVWKYKCGSVLSRFSLHSCSWSEYTYWDEVWGVQQGEQRIIAGMASYHSNHREDRRFKFKFCSIRSPYGQLVYFDHHEDHGRTDFDSEWSFEFDSWQFLYEIKSWHSNWREDRQFLFRTATVIAPSDPCTDRPVGWVSSTGNTCDDYVQKMWCTCSAGYGAGWKNSYGTFDTWAVNGVSAREACCGCNGGSHIPTPAPTPSPPTPAPTPVVWVHSRGCDTRHGEEGTSCFPGAGCSSTLESHTLLLTWEQCADRCTQSADCTMIAFGRVFSQTSYKEWRCHLCTGHGIEDLFSWGVYAPLKGPERRLSPSEVAGTDIGHADFPEATIAWISRGAASAEEHGITSVAVMTAIKAYSTPVLAVPALLALCVLLAPALRGWRATKIENTQGDDADVGQLEL